MVDIKDKDIDFLRIKIVQSGEWIKRKLSKENLTLQFKKILLPLLKDLKLKEKNILIGNASGRMLSPLEFNLPLKSIIKKLGTELSLHSEKIF